MTSQKQHDEAQYDFIIVGAGNAGEGLVRDLLRGSSLQFKPIVFVDDDIQKVGREIHGVRVGG